MGLAFGSLEFCFTLYFPRARVRMRMATPGFDLPDRAWRVRFFYGIAPYASTDMIEAGRTAA